jgi:hypothetical protein
MSGRCIGEPVSWLRLERLHLGEISGPERARIEEHLAACRACAACLASIVEGDAQALPPLALPERRRRATLSFLPLRAASVVGGLAAAAAVALSIRGGDHPLGSSLGQRLEGRIKGDAVAFSLVREDDERITGAEGVYRDGDRFKAVVTCPPGANLALDVVVYDEAGASFPLDPAPAFACGNQTPMEGAFRLTGAADETVCLVWKEGAPVDRGPLSARAAAGDTSSCKRLHASTGRR